MLEHLIVVDYQEGARGEFLANFISAHWGHPLSQDLQRDPNWLQKWLNSQSLIRPDWNSNFDKYLNEFVNHCLAKNVKKISVPYHLYKWPSHIKVFQDLIKSVRFVKINSIGYEKEVYFDFQRKISNRAMTVKDLKEIKFLLTGADDEQKIACMKKLKQGTLLFKDIRKDFVTNPVCKLLPSQDVEILYGDFFMKIESTSAAYSDLCQALELEPRDDLLQILLSRNKKNLHDQTSYINSL